MHTIGATGEERSDTAGGVGEVGAVIVSKGADESTGEDGAELLRRPLSYRERRVLSVSLCGWSSGRVSWSKREDSERGDALRLVLPLARCCWGMGGGGVFDLRRAALRADSTVELLWEAVVGTAGRLYREAE